MLGEYMEQQKDQWVERMMKGEGGKGEIRLEGQIM